MKTRHVRVRGGTSNIIFGLVIAIFLAAVISPFASSKPDGLEKVMEGKGEAITLLYAIVPDYIFPGIKNEKLATSVAGVVGTLIVFLAFQILSRTFKWGLIARWKGRDKFRKR